MAALVTVTGRFELPNSVAPGTGTMTWTLVPGDVPDTAEPVTVLPGPVTVPIDAAGAFTVTLRATDDPDLTAHVSGPLRYEVTRKIETAKSSWYVSVPRPGPWDWAALSPVIAVGNVVVNPVPGPPGPPGPAGATGPAGPQGPAGPVGNMFPLTSDGTSLTATQQNINSTLLTLTGITNTTVSTLKVTKPDPAWIGDYAVSIEASDYNLAFRFPNGNLGATFVSNSGGGGGLTITNTQSQLFRLHSYVDIQIRAGTVYPNSRIMFESDGAFFQHGPANNEQSLGIRSLVQLTTIAAAAFTDTTIQIPAASVIFAVSTRVVTAIPTAASYDVGVSGAATRYGAGISSAAGSTSKGTNDATRFYSAATSIRITPNLTPAAATGQVRVTIWYYDSTPPTS